MEMIRCCCNREFFISICFSCTQLQSCSFVWKRWIFCVFLFAVSWHWSNKERSRAGGQQVFLCGGGHCSVCVLPHQRFCHRRVCWRILRKKRDTSGMLFVIYMQSVYRVIFALFFFLGPSMLANSFILSWIRPDTVVRVKREIIWDIWITGSHVLNSPTDNEGENKAANVSLYTLNGIY